MELKLIDEKGAAVSNMNASDTLFGREYNEALIHQVITAFMANARAGTRAQKGRSEVSKSTRKPWRQKGTGRARAGMASSPLWRGGGKIFPNSPDENFSHKLNKKMYRAGLQSILSELARQDRLSVVETLNIDSPKTKLFSQKMKDMGFQDVLVVTDTLDDNLLLSSRNLAHVWVVDVPHVDPVSLLKFSKVLMTRGAVQQMEEMLA